MKESAWLKFGEVLARFWSARLGVMPRESFLRKREKGVENRKTTIGGVCCSSQAI